MARAASDEGLAVDRSLVEQVARELRSDILAGRLAPGARVQQRAVAARLGTSRLPVREALRLLEKENLVLLRPNAPATVSLLSLREMYEVYRMRERLEPLAIGESINLLTDQQVDEIRKLHAMLDDLPVGSDAWLEADKDFHLSTIAAAPMPRLIASVVDLLNAATRYRRMFGEQLSVLIPTQRIEHSLLMSAVVRRDARDAEAILEMHLRRARTEMATHAEYLTGAVEE